MKYSRRVMPSLTNKTAVQLFVLVKRRWQHFGDNRAATVALTDDNGQHEIRILDGSGQRHSIGFRSTKKCVIRRKTWLELTDRNTCCKMAVVCSGADPNFNGFFDRLVTLFQLLEVKFEYKNSATKFPLPPEISNTSTAQPIVRPIRPRPLPPLPLPRPRSPLPSISPEIELSNGGGPGINDGCNASERRSNESELGKEGRGGGGRGGYYRLLSQESSRGFWTCFKCNFRNSLSYSKCSVCGYQRNLDTSAADLTRVTGSEYTVNQSANGSSSRATERSGFHRPHAPPPPPSVACSECRVQEWGCPKCTFVNSAGAFLCDVCRWTREDAWQCHVCQCVVSLKVTWCRRCDVWRCQLCHRQNDARENDSRNCKTCGQFRT